MTIVLNPELEIERVRGAFERPVTTEPEPGGGAIRYSFVGVVSREAFGGRRVSDLCIEYSGTHPVYDVSAENYREDDGSGVIAFNGETFRARGFARWHPTPYDPSGDIAAEALSYELEIRCATCSALYVNGGPVTPGPAATFRSDEAREILLIAGRVGEAEHLGVTFIGNPVPAAAAEAFAVTLGEIRGFLEGYVEVPFGPLPQVVALTAVRRPRRGQLWGFFSDPAFALVGMTIPELVSALDGTPTQKRAVLGFLAHEMAHRYFGWRIGVESPQRDLFGEPFATYLEVKAIRHFLGEDAYQTELRNLQRRYADTEPPTRLDLARVEDFARSSYRYGYSPFMLLSLERAIGEESMRRVIATMLQAPVEERFTAGFEFIARTAASVGVPAETWQRWEEQCLAGGTNASECAIVSSD